MLLKPTATLKSLPIWQLPLPTWSMEVVALLLLLLLPKRLPRQVSPPPRPPLVPPPPPLQVVASVSRLATPALPTTNTSAAATPLQRAPMVNGLFKPVPRLSPVSPPQMVARFTVPNPPQAPQATLAPPTQAPSPPLLNPAKRPPSHTRITVFKRNSLWSPLPTVPGKPSSMPVVPISSPLAPRWWWASAWVLKCLLPRPRTAKSLSPEARSPCRSKTPTKSPWIWSSRSRVLLTMMASLSLPLVRECLSSPKYRLWSSLVHYLSTFLYLC